MKLTTNSCHSDSLTNPECPYPYQEHWELEYASSSESLRSPGGVSGTLEVRLGRMKLTEDSPMNQGGRGRRKHHRQRQRDRRHSANVPQSHITPHEDERCSSSNRLPRKSNKCSKKTGSGREAGKEELRKKTQLKAKQRREHRNKPLQNQNSHQDGCLATPLLARPAQNSCDSTNSQSMEDVNGLEQRAIRVLQSATRLQRAPQRSSPIDIYHQMIRPPPRDEYAARDEEIPPYRAQLHKYLDLVSYDERFSPVLRVNRYLVRGEGELSGAINKLSCSNVLPKRTNLWAVSHIDDNEYEQMVPALISEGS